MRDLKQRNLWKPPSKLAARKGRWIVGGAALKASQHYPDEFGKAVHHLVFNPMDINGAVNLINHTVIVQFRMDRAEAPGVFLAKIARAKEEEIHEGPLKRCSGRFCNSSPNTFILPVICPLSWSFWQEVDGSALQFPTIIFGLICLEAFVTYQ